MSLGRKTPLRRKSPLRARPKDKSVPLKARNSGNIRRHKGPIPKRAFKTRPRPQTEAEREHSAAIHRMRCWACEVDKDPCPPPSAGHHIKEEYGAGQKASDWEMLPLCEGHHQGNIDRTRLAYHRAPRTWCARYGNQVVVLRIILARRGLTLDDIPRLRGSYPPWWGRYKRGYYDQDTSLPENTRRILTQPQEQL